MCWGRHLVGCDGISWRYVRRADEDGVEVLRLFPSWRNLKAAMSHDLSSQETVLLL
jgi:hypothetical protein